MSMNPRERCAIGASEAALARARQKVREEAERETAYTGPRDPCTRCQVRLDKHAEHGCKRYTPGDIGHTPLISYNVGCHALS